MASTSPILTGPRILGTSGLLAMATGVLLLLWGPERSEDLLARTVAMTATSDSIDGGHSQSRLLPAPKGTSCVWKLRPGFRYPWAGLRFDLVRPGDEPVDLSWSRTIRMRMEASPASNIRLQVLSQDRSRQPARTTAHAREFNVAAGLDTAISWQEFRIPAWFRDSTDPVGDQRLELLAQATAIDIQSAYIGPGHDSTTLRILMLEARGPSPVWRTVGLSLVVAGALSLAILFLASMRIAYLRTKRERLGALVDGRKSVQLDTQRIRLRQEVQTALKERFADPGLSLESFSSDLKLPPRTVAALLKEATDLNFKPALNELRLAEAARLLSETDGAVAEIGYAVGFQNHSHFGRAFRERHGVSPSKWR
jgi:AraC-like DNA-binding protein